MADGGDDFAALGGAAFEEADIEVAVEGGGECAWDGCGGHDEHIGCIGAGGEAFALEGAEFVLFINDDEAEAGEGSGLVEEAVCADDELGLGGGGIV